VKSDEEHRALFATWVNVLRPSEGVSFAKGLAFPERDIAQDRGALADLKKLGCMTTPVIVIDGAVIVGFDSGKIDEYVVG
jgi:glutaredoxin